MFLESFKDIKQQFGPALCIDHEPQLGQNSRGCLSAGFYCKYTFLNYKNSYLSFIDKNFRIMPEKAAIGIISFY